MDHQLIDWEQKTSKLLEMFSAGDDEYVDASEVASFCLFVYCGVAPLAWPDLDVSQIAYNYVEKTLED